MKKTCKRCHETKPHSDFHKDPRARDGHKGVCANCCNAELAAWRKANPVSAAESRRKWRTQNPEANLAGIRRHQDKIKAETGMTAINKNAKWSYEDLETVMRTDLTLLEISKMLGRTYISVAVRRSMIRDRQGQA